MNIFLIAFRTLKNFKLYNIINILGLAMSLACTITLSRYIYRELTIDEFNENIDRVYAEVVDNEVNARTLSHLSNPNGEAGYLNPADHPSIEAFTEYIILPDHHVTYNDQRYIALIYAVDSLFLPITAYPLSEGDVNSLFRSPNDAVISSQFAKKMFGDEDPVGKTIIYSTGKHITIKGVLKDDATKRFMKFDVLVSIDLERQWSYMSNAFMLLHKGSSIDDINKAHSEYKTFKYTNYSKVRSQFVSYKSLYFDQTMNWGYYERFFDKGNYNSIVMLMIVAVVVFFIGVFNFVNIYTVMLLKRGKEFGLKKVYGVGALNIFMQLIVENIMLVLCSVALGWIFIISAKEFLVSLNIPQISHVEFDVAITLFLIIFVSIITSLYPYLKYRREMSISSMQKMSNLKSTSFIRSLLLMLQYIVSISMMIFSIYFVKQLNFMLEADLGFNTADVVEAKFFHDNNTRRDIRENIEAKAMMVQTQLNSSPIVKGYYFGSRIDELAGSYKAKRLGGEYSDVQLYYIGPALSTVYDIDIVNGRMPVDSIDNHVSKYNMWINESAAKIFDVKNLDTTKLQLNQRVWWSYDTDENYNPPYSINGVVRDCKISHLKYATDPAIYIYYGNSFDETLVVRFEKGRLKEGLELLKTLYNEYLGSGDLKYDILADRVEAKYKNDKLMATIFTIFTIITLIISSLGLFSLSLYDIERRYREIALRRVCGAQSSQIMQMFLVKYMRQLLIAFFVASVLSYALVNFYMRDFAVRTPLSWWLFVVAALITALISLITLVWQTKKAADTNPAKIMKTE